ncbi:MAG: hypothetical protein Q8K42_03010 [Methylobacter sp.]|nr:hypothetical protein [Methylobacter sp.]
MSPSGAQPKILDCFQNVMIDKFGFDDKKTGILIHKMAEQSADAQLVCGKYPQKNTGLIITGRYLQKENLAGFRFGMFPEPVGD